MAFIATDLAALAQGNGFTLWHYATADRQGAVLTVGYLDAARGVLRAGDLIVLQTADTVGIVAVHAVAAPGASLGAALVLDTAVRSLSAARVAVQSFSLDATISLSLAAVTALLLQSGGRLLRENGGVLEPQGIPGSGKPG